MNAFWSFLYNLVITAVIRFVLPIASIFNSKIKESVQNRKNWFSSLQAELGKLDPRRKRILFHCPSAGEWAQAVPIIETIKKSNPAIDIIASFLSPSGYNFFKGHSDLAFKVYLPFDSRSNAFRFLRSVNPDLWIISKYDVWPNHLMAAQKLRIPVIMTSALLSEKSRRGKGFSKHLNRQIYRIFQLIFPVSEADYQRFLQIYPYPERLFTMGSTGFDQVYNHSLITQGKEKLSLFKTSSADDVIFIGGSIWPSDEVHLMPALIECLGQYQNLKAILAPHEPHEKHILDIENTLRQANIKSQRYTDVANTGGSSERVIIINTIGMLAKIYHQTDIAYVGGSCGPGVHNVTEPAVFGQAVLFGPRYRNSFEAIALKDQGCGFVIENRQRIKQILDQFINDREYRNNIGQKALNLIKAQVGASDRIVEQIRHHFDFIH